MNIDQYIGNFCYEKAGKYYNLNGKVIASSAEKRSRIVVADEAAVKPMMVELLRWMMKALEKDTADVLVKMIKGRDLACTLFIVPKSDDDFLQSVHCIDVHNTKATISGVSFTLDASNQLFEDFRPHIINLQ
jgi:hypothetical protein